MVIFAREAGHFERFFTFRNVESAFPNFSFTAKYSRKFTKAQLSRALSEFLKKNTWFTYNFFKTSTASDVKTIFKDWELRTLEEICFDDVVTFEQIESFETSTINETVSIECPVNVKLPLWRIKVFETNQGDQYLCMILDHIIFDGISGMHFHEDLCSELSAASEGNFVDVLFDRERDIKYLPETPIPPTENYPFFKAKISDIINIATQTYTPLMMKAYKFVRSKFNIFEPNLFSTPLFENKTGEKPFTTDTTLRSIHLDPGETNLLKDHCHRNGLTITPFINVVFLQCLEEIVFPAINPHQKYSTDTYLAINARRYLPKEKPFQYGNIFTFKVFVLPPILQRKKVFMEYVQRELDQAIETGSANSFIGLAAHLNYKLMERLGKTAPRWSILMSNIGKVPSTAAKYEIEDMFFGQSVGTNSYTTVCIVSTEKGGMNIIVCSLKEFDDLYENDSSVMDELMKSFRERITNLG